MTKKVAIVGAAYRFPGAATVEAFSEALREERDLVTHVASDRWDKHAFQHPDRKHPGTSVSLAAGSLGDISRFDADFFGISPREAAQMDPQQRLMLELAWETLEHAGIPPSRLRGSNCGVYLGVASLDYSWRLAEDLSVISTTTATGNTSSIVANRLSYLFDLHGPSISMDTACSSAMVAFHQACQAIRSGETSMALTGAISLHLHPYGFIIFSKASMLSANGRCRAFDADGDGYVRSEGAGMFLLKDHDQAVADGDRILAVVAGSGVNTDGSKQGLTVPNHHAQSELIQRTLKEAGLTADQLSYLEAHGTGTSVGDPLEVQAIGEALGTHRQQPLPIGSVKSNLGHMETASGIAGIAKALHVITEREIPATIGIRRLNPRLESDKRNIEVITQRRPLVSDGKLIVGINSFGFGGANAHVILESPESLSIESRALSAQSAHLPQTHDTNGKHHEVCDNGAPGVPLRLTARTPAALRDQASTLADYLQRHDAGLEQVASQLWFRRDPLQHGLLLWPEKREDAIATLRGFASTEHPAYPPVGERLISSTKTQQGAVFVYSGNGCQWFTMGRDLLHASREFAIAIDAVDALFMPLGGFSLREEIEGLNGDRLAQTEIAQPTLFALQVALTRLLAYHGIKPAAVIGHSVGEVAAAWASGALNLEQAVKVIRLRSYHQGRTRGQGAMMAANLNVDALRKWLNDERFDRVELAGRNSANGVTLAGDSEQIHALAKSLSEERIFARVLPLDYAFHSPAMDAIEEGLLEDLTGLQPSDTHCVMISTVTGSEIEGTQLDAIYWWDNIRQPVVFHAAISTLINKGYRVFNEIGAHPILHRYLTDTLEEHGQSGIVIDTLIRPKAEQEPQGKRQLERSIAQLWLSGIDLPIDHWLDAHAPVVDLPHYAWQRSRHWYTNSGDNTGVVTRHYEHPLLGYRLAGHDLTWQSDLDTQRLPWLADHNVGDSVIFPAAGFTELALAAAAAWKGTPLIELEAVEILSPLVLDQAPSKQIRLAIDDRDGSLNIRARETASLDPWHLHSRARIPGQTLGLSLKATAPELPDRPADFSHKEHIAAAQAIGLNYGEAFQGLSHGWIEGTSVIGVLEGTPRIDRDQADCLLPPGLLDSALQLFIPLLKQHALSHDGMAFVPVRFERVQFQIDANPVRLAHVCLTQQSPHSLCADIALFDANGTAVAVIRDARFKAVRLHADAHTPIQHLVQHLVPAPLPPSVLDVSRETSLDETRLLDERQLRALHDAVNQASTRYRDELDPLLDAMIHAFVFEALEQTTDEDTRQQLRTLAESLDIIDASGALAEPASNSGDIWRLALQDYPDYAHLIIQLGRIGRHLADIPRVTTQLNALWRSALGNSVWQTVAEQLEPSLAEMRARVGTERVCIVEVAAERLEYLPRMSSANIVEGQRSIVIALDDTALANAKIQAEYHPGLDIQQLDTHATPSADAALIIINAGISGTQLKLLLEQLPLRFIGPAQLLLVAPAASSWQTLALTMGDKTHTEHTPATLTDIQHLLTLFDYPFSHSDDHDSDNGLRVISAQLPTRDVIETTTPVASHWLIVSDASSETLASTLSTALSARHQHVEHQQDFTDIATWWQQANTVPQHIIDLRGLAISPALRCQNTAAWWQWIEQQQASSQLWLIGCGVCDQWHSQAVTPEKRHYSVTEDAALWGFGRTLQNEAGKQTIHLVDLPAVLANAAADEYPPLLQQALVTHLCAPDDELEVTFTLEGKRLAPRLVEAPLSAPADARTALTLGFDVPGQLRHLYWKPRVLKALGDNDVEVEVKATGLNFRDVMYALGLLSDEAVEQGFAGASLGLEFSGKVVNVGASVTRFSPGDNVVGFGPSSFSTRLIAQQHSLARIPQGMDFAAAATLPTTFFTVYYSLKHQARLEEGERLLIHGAAGGVGLAAVQIGQWMGAEIYATAGSDEKRDVLRLLGVEHIYDSRSFTFAEALLADTEDGRGVDVVLNSLAGEAIAQNLRVLNPFGRFIELGKRDFYENTKVGLRPFRNNLSYFGVDSDQLMSMRPALTERLFTEMMALFEEGTLTPLPYTAFAADRTVDAFRFMQQARQVGKVVITYDKVPQATPARMAPIPLALDTNASYLITGGLSGFGLATAHWLADQGARHLVLLSRSGANRDEAKTGIEALMQRGVQVRVEACDVTDRHALANVLEHIRSSGHPLKGTVHAATVIDDGLVRDLTAERIANSLNAKIEGARLLDELTRKDSLDFFVLFSSATTLFGNPGQASYVAANLWLEGLAAQRHRQGLCATCIAWGAIDDVGFLARNTRTRDSLTQRLGGRAMGSAEALNELSGAIRQDIANEGILPFDWSAMARFLPTAKAPRFELLPYTETSEQNGEDDTELREYLAQLAPEQLREALIKLLRKELATILLSDEASMDIERSVYDMGFDSLMGMELVTALEGKLGIQVPVMILNDSATIAKLADYLATRVSEGETAGEADDAVLAQADLEARHGVVTDREGTK